MPHTLSQQRNCECERDAALRAPMAPFPLPADVATFIEQQLLSIDEIEVLTVLVTSPPRWWDAKLMGTEVGGIAVAEARRILDHLASLNLLDIRVTDAVRYRFQPGTEELARTVSGLVSLYKTDRQAVVRAVRHTDSRIRADWGS